MMTLDQLVCWNEKLLIDATYIEHFILVLNVEAYSFLIRLGDGSLATGMVWMHLGPRPVVQSLTKPVSLAMFARRDVLRKKMAAPAQARHRVQGEVQRNKKSKVFLLWKNDPNLKKHFPWKRLKFGPLRKI